MKSGIVTRSDPYLMDPSFMVDPNLILDYGSSFTKDEVYSNHFEPFMDLINYNDTQLENIILNSGLCGEQPTWVQQPNEIDFDDFLKSLDFEQEQSSVESPAASTKSETDASTTCSFPIESEIANYEEVYSDWQSAAECNASEVSQSVQEDVTEPEMESESADDTGSVQSFSTVMSGSTMKRKISQDSDTEEEKPAPKRRKATRRTKRVQDERVKNQNKVAAMKYRRKKREEKSSLDDILFAEEEKNKMLKSSVEELKVNIDVLKELLGKYLSPSQMKASPKQN